MNKKLLAACLVLAAFAAVPSFASANPVLTSPTGTVLATGTKLVGTNVGNGTFVTSVGTLTCTSIRATGTLTKNNTSEGVEGTLETAVIGGTGGQAPGEPASECTGSNFFTPNTSVTVTGLPWCLSATATTDTGTVKGGACGEQRTLSVDLVVTSIGTCEYVRSAAGNATVVTDGGGTNENTGSISEMVVTLASGPAICPSEGKLSGRMSLETETGTPIFISS